MKRPLFFPRLSTSSTFWVFLALAPLACAAVTNIGGSATNQPPGTNATAGSKTNLVATNSASSDIPVPLSMFDLTLKPTKDPFFPLSTRQPIPVIVSNTVPAISISSFVLKGLSGATNLRLALINNRTLAAGEDAEITTTSGKVKIHCVDIKESSVIIRVSSQPEPLEIFLRKAAQ